MSKDRRSWRVRQKSGDMNILPCYQKRGLGPSFILVGTAWLTPLAMDFHSGEASLPRRQIGHYDATRKG